MTYGNRCLRKAAGNNLSLTIKKCKTRTMDNEKLKLNFVYQLIPFEYDMYLAAYILKNKIM